jgi:hypothetical protein
MNKGYGVRQQVHRGGFQGMESSRYYYGLAPAHYLALAESVLSVQASAIYKPFG